MLATWTILAAVNFAVGNVWVGLACMLNQLVCVGCEIAELLTEE